MRDRFYELSYDTRRYHGEFVDMVGDYHRELYDNTFEYFLDLSNDIIPTVPPRQPNPRNRPPATKTPDDTKQ